MQYKCTQLDMACGTLKSTGAFSVSIAHGYSMLMFSRGSFTFSLS